MLKKTLILIAVLVSGLAANAASQDAENKLIGAWKTTGEPATCVRFLKDGILVYRYNNQWYWAAEYGADSVTLRDEWGISLAPHRFTIEGGTLHIEFPFLEGDFDMTRLDGIPPELSMEPLELGSAELTAEEITAIAAEVARRRDAEQSVRAEMSELLQASGGGKNIDKKKEADIMSRMDRIDLDNKTWLIDTLRRVGWIDAARFGKDAAEGAFLIVQHSVYLPLMLAALPKIKEDVDAGLADGADYALLYDRTMLKLGGKQRYGSQFMNINGEWYLYPLEDPDKVDEYRREMGMGTLDELEKRYGGNVKTTR